MRQHSVRQRVWRMLLWNWYEIVNLLLSASTFPNAQYAMLSGTIYQFVPSFTVHPPLLLARKLNSHNKIAIYPLELSLYTPRGKALSVLLCGAPPAILSVTAWNWLSNGDRKWWNLTWWLRSACPRPIVSIKWICQSGQHEFIVTEVDIWWCALQRRSLK